jgi:riboflavin biosynthesis pyrimidine reductase
MNRTRATLLAAVALMSLGATGCHRHRIARGMYPTAAYQPVAYQPMARQQPIVIVVETRGQVAPEAVVVEDNSAQEAAAREAAAREEAMRQAQIAREKARIEREQAEQARRAAEQAQRDAQARAAAQGGTTIIVLTPGQKPVQVDGTWFQGQ